MAIIQNFIDTRKAIKKLDAIERQIPFAIASTLTALAKDGQRAAQNQIIRKVDRPTPFTKKAVAIRAATKTNMVSTVLIKPLQAAYLATLETGGVVIPEPGSPIAPPVNIRINVFGNIPRKAIARELSKPNVFRVSRRDKEHPTLPPGIYRRARRGKRGGGGGLTMLVGFRPQARYKPVLGFERTVVSTVMQQVQRRWRENLVKAIRTAKVS